MLLSTTSAKIRVTTSSTAAVNVHAEWTDLNGTTVTPGSLNTAISTATTTDVVSSPGASTSRRIIHMSIVNDDTTNPNTITVINTDGTTALDVYHITLAAQAGVDYVHGQGWVIQGSNPGTYPDIQVFNGTGGTWTKPTTFTPKVVIVEIIGGGGGGGAGASLATAVVAKGGGGGGGGSWAR